MSDTENAQMARMMAQALAPMLQQLGLPPNLFDLISKIKIKDFDVQLDEEINTVYASLACEDTESAERLKSLANTLLQRIKGQK